ncbi:beta-lactamase family protein [Psychrobacter sp. F1192]|uniref:Beta-lactamase family protein n=1 Tax=Psychrobacter coccoides TaxID=2818440 RepID=A0ABS3NKT2_9GAMM|nr:serine hydrolase domain-containing protein [Psychrobacter coccoides]MBO1529710.1 beta-lactamase family protein [Psychrobacter coccoides]
MQNNMNELNQAHDTDGINTKLQQYMQELLTDLQLDDAPAGGSVVVYQGGKCVAIANVGMAQADKPWQADTLSLNFSTGKGVLATLVHVLVSKGLLDYDEPIASYWPEFAQNDKAAITLRAVLSHQANLFAINTIDADSEALLNWDVMLKKVAAMSQTPPDNAIAYDSAYSALVYGWVLGGLIEAVTDMSLAAALQHYLTQPLGIADSCYFGVPANKVDDVARLVKDFESLTEDSSQLRSKRHKPTLKPDSAQTLATYASLPSYQNWLRLVNNNHDKNVADGQLNALQINRLYFNHKGVNANNYRAALVPANKQPIDYHDSQTMQAVIPAANGIASTQALAIIYSMLANGGIWQGQTLIDSTTFAKLSTPQVSGMDAVMPVNMNWRLGYHELFSLGHDTKSGFGHMGYNGSVAWCDPSRQLSFAFVHNFDVTMLGDIRQFALTEALIAMIDKGIY